MSDEGSLYEYSGNQLVGTSVTFLILNTVSIVLRFYARFTTKAKLGYDDYLIVPALFFNLSLDAACLSKQFAGSN